MSESKKFDPLYNIPSMEELDRQWREMEAAGNSQKKSTPSKKAYNETRSAMAARNTANNAKRGAGASRGQTASQTKKAGNPETKGMKKTKKKKTKRFRKFRMFLKVLLLLLLILILGAMVVLYFKYGDDLLRWRNEAKELVESSTKDTFRSSEASTIYGSNDKVIAKVKGDKDSSYIEFPEIPQAAIDCMLVTEDRDFYEHQGVDFMSSAKAAALYVKGKMTHNPEITRGGSTITQQVVKNVFLSNAQTEERKVREMFIAIELEKKYTKDEIMEFYLNVICFANNHFGIESASKAYFSKSVKELDLAEIAFLCAIPNRPTTYDPLEHFDNTKKRQVRILDQLLEYGKITAAEYTDAKYEDIILDPAEAIKNQEYTTTYAISCAVKSLMKAQGFVFQNTFVTDSEKEEYDKEYQEAYDECNTMLHNGGYSVYTSISNSKQKKLQKSVNDALRGFKEKTKDGTYKLQGAATCIDNKTGFVVAIVGGRKQQNSTAYSLNRAFQSYRQPGSCFKPLVVYTPQLERDYTPDSIVDDTYFKGGPKNSSGTYSGKIPLRSAVENSKNVVAWKLFEELTPKVGLNYVLRMNFSQIVDSDYYPAASLGGLTNGVSTVEMASAYTAIENDGVYREPTCVKKIVDAKGNMVIDNRKNREKIQIYEETASRMMTDILTGVLIRGTARGHALSDMPCAGKTGTTSDKKDGWFCGYTPYYTTTVWVGYDNPKTVYDLYGYTYPLTIWQTFMEDIHQNLERIEFLDYEGSSKKKKKNYNNDTEPTMDPDARENDNKDADIKDDENQEDTDPVETKTPTPTQEPEYQEEEPAEDVGDDDEGFEDIPEEDTGE